jgi:hypothetical protein
MATLLQVAVDKNPFHTLSQRKMMMVSSILSLDEDAKHISMLKSQLNLLNQQLKMLQDKQARKKDKRRASRLNSAGVPPVSSGLPYPKPAKQSSIPGAGSKRGRKKRVHESDDEKMPETDITYEQKRELSDSINILPADKLPQVFEIIKENANLNVNHN